jgi:sortase A
VELAGPGELEKPLSLVTPASPAVPVLGKSAVAARSAATVPLGARVTAWTLAAISGLAVWILVYAFFLSGLQEASAQHSLYAQLRHELAPAIETAPLGSHPALGTPVAILRVPQAGIDDVVLEGTSSGVLEHGPGLLADTPLPGRAGNSFIFGRQTMFGGPFRHLTVLQKGDPIQVITGQGTFNYVVTSLQYPRTPKPPALEVGQSRLTLVTAAGAGWHSAGMPDEILYVNAMLRGSTVGSPGGLPDAVPSSQLVMHGDTSVLFPLVLWLQLLLLVVVAVAWVRSRWGRWQTWLVGAPLILAVLWVVTDTAVQLFPNLI